MEISEQELERIIHAWSLAPDDMTAKKFVEKYFNKSIEPLQEKFFIHVYKGGDWFLINAHDEIVPINNIVPNDGYKYYEDAKNKIDKPDLVESARNNKYMFRIVKRFVP